MDASGGPQQGDEAMLEKARRSMDAGAAGLIVGRNIWQRQPFGTVYRRRG